MLPNEENCRGYDCYPTTPHHTIWSNVMPVIWCAVAGNSHSCMDRRTTVPGDCTEQDLLASVEQENPVKVVCSIVLCYSPSIVKKIYNNLVASGNFTCGVASENNTVIQIRMHLYF